MRTLNEDELILAETWSEYIPFKIKPSSSWKAFVAEFEIPAEYAPAGHPVSGPIKFEVNISGTKLRSAQTFTLDDIFKVLNGEQFNIQASFSAVVTYRNSLTSMQQSNFEGNIAFLIYSTVVKVVKVYAERFKPEVIQFGVAHEGLKKIYNILCLKAQQTFGYYYGNPAAGKNNSHFFLISPEVVSKLKAYFSQKNAQGASA